MRNTLLSLTLLAIFIAPVRAKADDGAQDGTYEALVTTKSGTYTVPVEVNGGEISHVYWPNGGQMDVINGELDGGIADGLNRRGDPVHVEIYDSSYEADSSENE